VGTRSAAERQEKTVANGEQVAISNEQTVALIMEKRAEDAICCDVAMKREIVMVVMSGEQTEAKWQRSRAIN
jgi:hypothetical protein